MAFVLVQHLAPSRESALAGILSRATSMPVTEVSDEPEVRANRVYVIPPNRSMVIERGRLKLSAREDHPHHPIDRFLRSLAESQRHMAIGVILSGTATDGTVGLEEIKAAGGITFAQEDAEYDGMPQSAIASGSVDFVLPPEGIAAEIVRIAVHPLVVSGTDGGGATRGVPTTKEELAPILQHVRAETGVDFTHYKANTLVRRITRRMVLLKKEHLGAYVDFLRESPPELEALYQDVLINVTSFFRDPETFEALKAHVIPALLRDRRRGQPIRVWVLGCSTGEEAYSIAMVLSEAMGSSDEPPQIFATDLNLAGVERARAGVYAKDRMENVSRERLRRFFVEVDGSFRICKPIRDMCVFSRHNALVDPPFSRMDLVSCRNLLIYLEPAIQQRVIPILHYALRPTGYLLLGASETVGAFRNLFDAEDARHKIFARKPGSQVGPTLLLGRSARTEHARRPEDMTPARIATASGATDLLKQANTVLLGFAPAAVLVDASLQILQFHGDIEPYLVHPQGKASLALLKMARPGLVVPLRALLERAKKESEPVREEGAEVEFDGRLRRVDVRVCPVRTPAASESGYLVVFEERAVPGTRDKPARKAKAVRERGRDAAEASITRLEHELASTREHLVSLTEQHEAAVEELQSANEEAQSANEELQSINEELETTKEEIQSSNEELTTVNDELNSRNLELGQLNNDLTNLIGNVPAAVVIVGRDLRIRRFSPLAEKLLNVIGADVGRSIADIRMGVDVPRIDALLAEVIDTVTPLECEVQGKDGRWYALRLKPYKTLENKIDGAVMTLQDVDAMRRAREFAESIVATVREPLLVLDADLRIRTANRSFYEVFRVAPAATEGRLVYELGDGQWDIPELRRLFTSVLGDGVAVEGFVVEHEFENIGRRVMQLNARRLTVPGETRESILLAIKDTSERVRAEEERTRLEAELHKRAEELDAANRMTADFIAVLSHELRSPLNAISGWAAILDRSRSTEADRREAVSVISRNAKLQAQLISDLLDVNRIATGSLSLELRNLDLRAEVQAAIETARPVTQEKGLKIAMDADPHPVLVRGDAIRLQQVLGNLLSNAVKFTPEGGEIHVVLRRQNPTYAEVSVRDTGRGIAREVLPHIFDRFRQGESQERRHEGGLGLGLAVARQLVELHGGSISAESLGKGKGATFTITLPLASPAHPAAVTDGAATPVSLEGVMVLVVDDDPEAREPVRRLLQERGAEVVAVRSADEAIDVIQRQRPDVLVSDIRMPGKDGYVLMRAVRALPPARGGHVPAIALTAFGSPEDRARALHAGYATHLSKPVEPATLVAAISALLSPRTEA